MNRGRFRVVCLWLTDVACVLFSLRLAGIFCGLIAGCGFACRECLRLWPIALAFTFVNMMVRLYHGRASYPAAPLTPVEEFRRLVLSSLATHVLAIALGRVGDSGIAVSHGLVATSCLLTALSAQLFRDAVRLLLWKLELGLIPAVYVGSGRQGDLALATIAADPYYGIRIVRRFPPEEESEVLAYSRAHDIKHLVYCHDGRGGTPRQLREYTGWFSYMLYISAVRSLPMSDAHAAVVGFIGGLEVSNLRRMKLMACRKSLLDGLLALLLMVLAMPFFILIPLAIKLTSRGPVFYRAMRLGRRGRMIPVLKFRSMYEDADSRLKEMLASDPALRDEFGRNFKLKRDPRVTLFGQLLRRTSLDELPQLINVLRGEMAFVGPRPIVEAEREYYGDRYEILSSVKPGITGLWQVAGRSDRSYEDRVALDMHYILNWSPWMDIWIVYRTFFAVLKMRGSY